VISKPDARKGEQPVASIAGNDGVTIGARELQHFLRRKLADYNVPKQILKVPALPRNATGKILKTVLREIPLEV
jgi:acyl-coenzyme A synthetase/AMP-(fatty) acid ligase